MGDFVIPQNWPIWAILVALGIKAFKKELAILIPTGIREHFAHRAKMREDAQEHEQEIEEVSIEAWFKGFHATQSGETMQPSGLPESEL